MNKSDKNFLLVGVDEAGRGPLAGPVCVAAVYIKQSFIDKTKSDFIKLAGNIKDSKKLSTKKRELIYLWIKNNPNIARAYTFSSAKDIDKIGISNAIKLSVDKTLQKLGISPQNTKVLLDGNLKAPEEFSQTTIIKGDENVLQIALASIVAKVERDMYMMRISNKFPQYGFERHKGYGTKQHIQAIKKYGLITEHRKSFCSRIVN